LSDIVIRQSQEEVRLAVELHQRASISRIRLARARLAAASVDITPDSRIEVAFAIRSKALEGPQGILRLEITFRMTGTERYAAEGVEAIAESKPESKVLVECVYETDYDLMDDFEPTPRHIKAFQDGNAIFNAWPYFREYLQSSLQRMGLPAMAAPFLRLQPKAKPVKKAVEVERGG
jgi:hypothetical protein